MFGNVCVARRSWTALCQPINEVCKPSSLKKHNIGHTHFHKHGHTQTLLSIQPDSSISGIPYVYRRRNPCFCVFFTAGILSLFEDSSSPFVVSVCVCVSLSLFGQAVKD